MFPARFFVGYRSIEKHTLDSTQKRFFKKLQI